VLGLERPVGESTDGTAAADGVPDGLRGAHLDAAVEAGVNGAD